MRAPVWAVLHGPVNRPISIKLAHSNRQYSLRQDLSFRFLFVPPLLLVLLEHGQLLALACLLVRFLGPRCLISSLALLRGLDRRLALPLDFLPGLSLRSFL